eukprot:6194423-Pleurochrysis_carterae.AAC.3
MHRLEKLCYQSHTESVLPSHRKEEEACAPAPELALDPSNMSHGLTPACPPHAMYAPLIIVLSPPRQVCIMLSHEAANPKAGRASANSAQMRGPGLQS